MIGSIKQEYSIYTQFSVKDHNDDVVFRIEGAGHSYNVTQFLFDYGNFNVSDYFVSNKLFTIEMMMGFFPII